MYYRPTPGEMPVGPMGEPGGSKCAAIIAAVHDEHTVNLGVFGADGKVRSKINVHLVQPKDADRSENGYCEWMPYQIKKPTGSESGERKRGTKKI